MRFYTLLLCLTVFSSSLCASIQMPRVDPHLFMPHAKIDFDKVESNDLTLKETRVKLLFDLELIDHFMTKSYDLNAQFSNYYKVFKDSYHLIDMNQDGNPELIFSGRTTQEIESEQFSIFSFHGVEPYQLYVENGHLLAYILQPNTKEILLVHHQYPCCENASHNLNRLRLVGGKISVLKRYFIGRDSAMKGDFFPKSAKFTYDFHYTMKKTSLRWSPEMIQKSAWSGRSETNEIAVYPSNSCYKVLAKKGSWNFVLMQNAPLLQENRVINPANFSDTWIFGWIKV